MNYTTSINNLDPEKITTSLALFNNLADETNEIRTLTTLNGDELIPKDFFDGIKLSNLDSGVLDKYVNTIGKINDYISSIKKNDGDVTSTESAAEVVVDFTNDGANAVMSGLSQSIDMIKKITDMLSSETNISPDMLNIIVEITKQAILNILNAVFALFGTTYGNILKNSSNSQKIRHSSGGSSNNFSKTTNDIPVEATEPITDEVESVEENPVVVNEEVVEKTPDNNKEGLVKETEETPISSLDSINGNKVINKIVDASGNVVAVSTMENGKKNWYQVKNNQVINPKDGAITTYKLNNSINIIDNGKTIAIDAGEYNVDLAIYDENGILKSVRLNNGEYKIVLGLSESGNIESINYIKTISGVFAIDNTNYDIYDAYGNIIGKFNNGQYYIYETMYSEIGDVVGFRLSPDGEYEQWLYVNSNTLASEYSFYEKQQTNDKTTISMFEKNKGLFGLLGVLFVALGATVIMKKRVAKKEQGTTEEISEDEYNSSEWEEQGLTTGNYPIYDVKTDEEGNVTDARINPLDNEFEYWVKV